MTRRLHWILIGLLLLAGILVYSNSFSGVFLFDDRGHLVDPDRATRIHSLGGIFQGPRPILHLSLAFNYILGGLNPWGYHWVNLIIHLLAGLVLFGILRRTINVGAPLVGARLPQGRAQGPPLQTFRNDGLAFSIALLWLVHPLQTQSVTYIIQRSESMMGLFYLLTLYAVIRSNEFHAFSWKIAAILFCLLGMGTKEVMVTAPVVILSYDRIFLAGSWKEILKKRGLLYLGFFATTILALWPMLRDPAGFSEGVGFGLKKITPLEYLRTQPGVILHYLRLCFWPHPLVIDYAWPVAETAVEIVPPLLVILSLVLVTLWALCRQPALGFLGVWFFLILAPTSSIVPILDPAFEHRMYLPLAAVITLVVIAASTVIAPTKQSTLVGATRRVAPTESFLAGNDVRMMLGFSFLLLTATAFAILTIQRNQDYASELGLWQDTLRRRPQNYRAYNNVGVSLEAQGNIDEALAHYEKSIQINPQYERGRFNLGTVLDKKGRVEEAAAHYEEVLRLNPNFADAHVNLGAIFSERNQLEEALRHYEAALKTKPRFAEVYYNIGNVLSRQGKPEEALRHYQKALALKPNFKPAREALKKYEH